MRHLSVTRRSYTRDYLWRQAQLVLLEPAYCETWNSLLHFLDTSFGELLFALNTTVKALGGEVAEQAVRRHPTDK